MPYITQERRRALKTGLPPENAGELNYLVTKQILAYIAPRGNYQAINDAVGALECAKLELYRRHAGPYEDRKIIDNGDVYSGDQT